MKACLAIFLAATVVSVQALPGGPPQAACDTLTPASVHGTTLQTGASPYCVNIIPLYVSGLNFTYTPNCTYTLSFFGCNNSDPTMPMFGTDFQYRGFFVQSRLADDTRVGAFATDNRTENEANGLSNCPIASDGINHQSRADKTCTTFRWTAPPQGTGDLYFRFAAVRTLSVFWAAQAVPVTITENANGTCPTPAAGFMPCADPPTMATTTMATTDGAVTIMSALSVLLVSLVLSLLI